MNHKLIQWVQGIAITVPLVAVVTLAGVVRFGFIKECRQIRAGLVLRD